MSHTPSTLSSDIIMNPKSIHITPWELVVPLYHFTTQHTTVDLLFFHFEDRTATLLVAGIEFQPSEEKVSSFLSMVMLFIKYVNKKWHLTRMYGSLAWICHYIGATSSVWRVPIHSRGCLTISVLHIPSGTQTDSIERNPLERPNGTNWLSLFIKINWAELIPQLTNYAVVFT